MGIGRALWLLGLLVELLWAGCVPVATPTPTPIATPSPTHFLTTAETPTPEPPWPPLKLAVGPEAWWTGERVEVGLRLVWLDYPQNESRYVVERSEAETGPWQEVAILPANSTTYLDHTVTVDSTYFYRVKAQNEAGDSPYSSVASSWVPPPPGPPPAPTPQPAPAATPAAPPSLK